MISEKRPVKGMEVPVVTLTTGLRVANFSSPHSFIFEECSGLEAWSDERATAVSLEHDEDETPHPSFPGVVEVRLTWRAPAALSGELRSLNKRPDVDVVLIPFPMLEALRSAGLPIGKARVIRVKDRMTRELYVDKFCVL